MSNGDPCTMDVFNAFDRSNCHLCPALPISLFANTFKIRGWLNGT